MLLNRVIAARNDGLDLTMDESTRVGPRARSCYSCMHTYYVEMKAVYQQFFNLVVSYNSCLLNFLYFYFQQAPTNYCDDADYVQNVNIVTCFGPCMRISFVEHHKGWSQTFVPLFENLSKCLLKRRQRLIESRLVYKINKSYESSQTKRARTLWFTAVYSHSAFDLCLGTMSLL